MQETTKEFKDFINQYFKCINPKTEFKGKMFVNGGIVEVKMKQIDNKIKVGEKK